MLTHSSSLTQTLRSSAFVLCAALLMACQGETVAQEVDASKYEPLSSPMKVSTGEKVEVIELFWFGCGHCYNLESSVKTWLQNKPENAEFVKVPALFSKRWEFHGQAYYTMQALGVPQQAYDDLFAEIHVKRSRIDTLPSLVKFLAAFDKTEEQVTSAFNSFEIDSKMRYARKVTRDSGATGVPAIIVDGKYRTSEQLGGKGLQMFQVVDQLIAKAAAER
ncbi:thiol:disulfide interchange protein DsbA/DsbL [Arenicella xantha]|uniref:Thiol:disulfide interchange protein n=1 Tax=Arenicella xantha TaxID=644221 RepID=A0A395JQ65_9GAMM|nr:thiol:disulfide interchange protein DsbA/DsbL [Arenicella xantha]RBP50850.1 thiol:disulfide interchange protein DsbA [Arenicella xantha]